MKIIFSLMMVLMLAGDVLAQSSRDRDSRDRDSRDRDRRSYDRRPGSSSGSSASPVADDNPDKSSFDRYRLLSEHNIFKKDRVQRPGPTTRDTSREGPRRPETAFVLRGCVIEGEEIFSAFVENVQSGLTMKATVGESIATGKVVEIGFDYLEYETGGQRTRIEVGQNFTGAAASSSTFVGTVPTTGPAATTGPVDESNLSIEERLRRRRMRELGQ